MHRKGIVWFRSDLRLHDNQALCEALHLCDQVLPVFIFDERTFYGHTRFGFRKIGIHRTRFLIESIQSLREGLRRRGSDLIVRIGRPEDELFALADAFRSSYIFCNRERTHEEVQVQDELERKLWSIGQEMRYERGKMLIHTQDLPFPVTHTPDSFSTFKKEVEHFVEVRPPFDEPDLKGFDLDIDPGEIPKLSSFDYDSAERTHFNGGEATALEKLRQNVTNLDRMDNESLELYGRSRLSPWISAGCLSPKMIFDTVTRSSRFINTDHPLCLPLMLRDYYRLMGKKYQNLIFLKGGPIRSQKRTHVSDPHGLERWIKGETNDLLVNSCMRELGCTGYLSHRGRSVVAHYLVDKMGVNWQLGASYFESILLDYDPCSNYGNWNRVGGVAPDPIRERPVNTRRLRDRFDHDGAYVRKWMGSYTAEKLDKITAQLVSL